MSNNTSYLDQLDKDLNGWKNFDPARGYGLTSDGPMKVIQDPPPKIRHDLLYKLYWPMFGPLDDIQVWEVGNNNDDTLVPFQDHPMTSEPLITASNDEVRIGINAVEERMNHIENQYDDEEDRWKGLEDLVLVNSKESPVTLKEFVTATHKYVNDTKNYPMIMECINMFYTGPPEHHGGDLYSVGVEADGTWPPCNKIPEGTTFFFDDVMDSGAVEGEWSITVDMFSEGEFGCSLERFWGRRRESQRKYELERQYYDI